jgi:lysophospholipase L1-like esterase
MSALPASLYVSPVTLLRLGRVSNLPTVWTNVVAATVLAGGALTSTTTLLAISAMTLFYVAGMYLNDAFDRYNAAVREVAQRAGATLIDLDRDVPRRAAYFADAVHLNDAGHKLVGHVVAREIGKLVDNQAIARSTP